MKIRDNTAYEWALAPAASENVWTFAAGKTFYPDGVWTTKSSCEIDTTGWYGFVIKIKGGSTGTHHLDISGKKLTDFFEIIIPTENPDNLNLKHGNKHMASSTTYYSATSSASSTVNIWLEAGSTVKIKDNATYEWTLLKTSNQTTEKGTTGQSDAGSYYPTNGWFSGESCLVKASGYYGFIIKYANGDGVMDVTNKNLLDYFEIVIPDSPQ